MVKDHSDSEKGNPLLPHRLLFLISSKGSFICTIPDRIAHTMAFVTPVVEHWLERKLAQWVHPMKDRSDDPSHHEWTLLPRSYISLPKHSWMPAVMQDMLTFHKHLMSHSFQISIMCSLGIDSFLQDIKGGCYGLWPIVVCGSPPADNVPGDCHRNNHNWLTNSFTVLCRDMPF